MRTQSLGQVELELRELAEELARLNLQQNSVLTDIDEVRREITKLENRRNHRMIQQEHHDKMLIHENLAAANRQIMRLRVLKGKPQYRKDVEYGQEMTLPRRLSVTHEQTEQLQELNSPKTRTRRRSALAE